MAANDLAALREQIKDNVEVALWAYAGKVVSNRADLKIITVHQGFHFKACVYFAYMSSSFMEGALTGDLHAAYEDLVKTSSRMMWQLRNNGKLEALNNGIEPPVIRLRGTWRKHPERFGSYVVSDDESTVSK